MLSPNAYCVALKTHYKPVVAGESKALRRRTTTSHILDLHWIRLEIQACISSLGRRNLSLLTFVISCTCAVCSFSIKEIRACWGGIAPAAKSIDVNAADLQTANHGWDTLAACITLRSFPNSKLLLIKCWRWLLNFGFGSNAVAFMNGICTLCPLLA